MIMKFIGYHVNVSATIHIQPSWGCGAFLGTKYPPTASLLIVGCDDEPALRLDNLTRADLELLKIAIKQAEDAIADPFKE